METGMGLFEDCQIRRVYDEEAETGWFNVIDFVQVLTQQTDYRVARNYWKVLKNRLNKEGSQLVTDCNQLKLPAADGKKYLTDVATAETLLRLVQSVPSPKAEPIKHWLAKVGYERMPEMFDSFMSLNRAREIWQKYGRSEKWIQQHMTVRDCMDAGGRATQEAVAEEIRNKLTDDWSNHNISQGEKFAILTNIIHQEWTGINVKDHKKLKGLKRQNLRDHMSEAELIFTA